MGSSIEEGRWTVTKNTEPQPSDRIKPSARTATTVKMAAVSTNGYTNVEGMKTTSQEEFSEEDGYFTCAVSVQHKKHDFETSSAYSASDSEHARKVVWPANQSKLEKQTVDTSKTFQNAFKQATGQVDQPHKWLQKSEHDELEKKIEKASFEMRQGAHRMSRSSSRSKNIIDRARSFERAAAESRGNSRPASRTGSIASRHRSPSGNRGQVDEMWMNQMERPGSRTDVDSRRFGEIGKVQTAEWEGRIKGSMENLPTRTPPPKRREINMKRNPDSDRGLDTKTPEPPPPPTRMTYPPNTIKEPEAEFPPPPDSDTKSKLSEESVGQLSEENKENIVKQWVESTTQSAEDIAKELEKFAYDIAETVVSNMEKNSEKKDSYGTHSQQSVASASTLEQMPNSLYADFWENQTSIATHKEFVAFSNKNNKATNHNSRETQKTQSSSGIYFAAPAATTRHELHGPVYVQEENRRVGMTFQQEERRREELRKQEEAKQEEKRRHELEHEAQRLQEEQQRKLAEIQRAQEEEIRRKEESKRLEPERQQKQALKRQEEERKRQIELEKQAEEKLRQEEIKRVEEQRLKQLEIKKIEEEKKRQEILKFEKLKQEEELKRQEEIRLEQEMRRQFEMQQQLDIQHQREQQLLLEQQQMLQQQKEMELQQAHSRQESMSVRDHIPKLSKTKSFEASQDRQNEIKHEDHLSCIKTGQVNEKRNFWIRSTSADRLNQVSLSPAPRRRRIDWNVNKQKDNEDPESRPGSSLGQAQTGSVKNLSSGFIAKSKSSAAVMQDEFERGRPKQKTVIGNGWTKEQYDQKIKQDFLKSQEVKTNKVNETVQTWGKRDSSATGRTTPAPSRNIGEVFSENRVGKTAETDSNANSWRTKTPEPTLKLVNVSVEKAIGSNQNIHISENAHKQMASFMTSSTAQQKEEVTSTVMTNTMSSQSSITSHSMSTTSRCSADNNIQPPPTPERNQSYGVAVRYLSQ